MEETIRKGGLTLLQIGEALGIRNLDPEAGLIFVTEGTGPVGHRVATRLLRAGYANVRLGAQKVDSLAEMSRQGAEIADFAWERPETYEKALDGVKSVLCTIPYKENWQDYFPLFLEACKKAKVHHFVKLSFYHARVSGDIFQDVPLVRAHGDCDDLLVKQVTPAINTSFHESVPTVSLDLPLSSNMSYTILAATHFMSNIFVFQGKELRESSTLSKFFGASGNHGVNYVSPNDVAEVAVRVLLAPREHFNKEYTLTGPEAIEEQRVADLLSKHLKKPVMYVDQPAKVFEMELAYGGEPYWMVKDLVALEKVKATGSEENRDFTSNDIEQICGHPPQTFEEYLQMDDMMTPLETGVPSELKPLKDAE